MRTIRTDMACELRENLTDSSGITSKEWRCSDANITLVEVLDDKGSTAIGRPTGKYFTLDHPHYELAEADEMLQWQNAASDFLSELLGDPKTVLIAGLGNRAVSADCIGPLVCEKVFVTRHILEHLPGTLEESTRAVCALAPGVLGVTGIESAEILKSVVNRIKPDCVIAVDALAARNIARLGCSLQITDTGISPGSGVGNNRAELSKSTLGIPVLAIGVPMVASAHTVAADLIEQTYAAHFEDEYVQKMVEAVFGPEDAGAVVTPKDVDALAKQVSDMLARILNSSLNGHVDTGEFIQ